jgi:hypothetical protein
MVFRLKNLLLIVYCVLQASFVYSADLELDFLKMIKALREVHTAKIHQKDLEIVFADCMQNGHPAEKICVSSVNLLLALDEWPIDKDAPKILTLGAAKAYGQLCLFSPFTLSAMDSIILPYLKDGHISYSDIRTPGFEFKFGKRFSRTSMDDRTIQTMENGQILGHNYKVNLPVYFNKLVGDFFGNNLLIGGGVNCECQKALERHPSDEYYTIDINNAVKPDMVAHACYIPHLQALPTERFSFIWFEHHTPSEFMIDYRAVPQYFRIARPGAVFLIQTNYFIRSNELGRRQEKVLLEGLKEIKLKMEKDFFTVADLSMKSEKHKLWYQMVIIKPFYMEGRPNLNPQEWATFELNESSLKNYRKANKQEIEAALKLVKSLTE